MSIAQILIKVIHRLIKYPRRFVSHIVKIYFNFLFPNFNKIIFNQIIFLGSKPFCNQKTITTGAGCVIFGDKCTFGYNRGGYFSHGLCEIQPRYKDAKIIFGNNININNNLFICAANYVKIGDNSLIGHFVSIRDHDAHSVDPSRRAEIGEIGSVEIGSNVWIGNNVIILKNTEIGNNTIIAAGAVVSGKFPENKIIGGVPARIIKDIE